MTTLNGAALLVAAALALLVLVDTATLAHLRTKVGRLEDRIDHLDKAQNRPASPQRQPVERLEPAEPNQPAHPLTSRDGTRPAEHPITVAMPTIRPAETPAERRAREREADITAWQQEQARRHARRQDPR